MGWSEEKASEESTVTLMELLIVPPFPFINVQVLLITYITNLVIYGSQYCSLSQKTGNLVS